jgi:hypothetical protein
MMRWTLALLITCAAVSINVMAASIFPTTLTSASLTIPSLPANQYQSDLIRGVSTFDQTFGVTITGGTGTGIFYINADINPYFSTSYNQSTEYIGGTSWLKVNDGPQEYRYFGQSTLCHCGGIEFTYGQPFAVRLQAYSDITWRYASWQGGPTQIDAGTTYRANAGGYVSILGEYVPGNPNATIVDPPMASASEVPEPATWLMMLPILAAVYILRCTRRFADSD